MQQRHVPRLADEDAESNDTQVGALALRAPPTRQLPRCGRRDVGVEVRRVEREDVDPGLLTSGADFWDDELFELVDRLVETIGGAISSTARP
jgi:hypothetical protein